MSRHWTMNSNGDFYEPDCHADSAKLITEFSLFVLQFELIWKFSLTIFRASFPFLGLLVLVSYTHSSLEKLFENFTKTPLWNWISHQKSVFFLSPHKTTDYLSIEFYWFLNNFISKPLLRDYNFSLSLYVCMSVQPKNFIFS